MEIPLQAQVECADGVCGRSIYLLINPVLEKVTHLVVRGAAWPHTELIVPMDRISETVAGIIHLRCSQAEFERMDPFVQTSFIQEKVPDYIGNREYGIGAGFYWPYVSPEVTVYAPVKNRQISESEVAVRRGTRVEATDGYVGQVDEFMINPETDRVTHLVMREGHLWGKKDVVIPLEAIGETREDTLLLKLNKQEIETLPTIALHRHYA